MGRIVHKALATVFIGLADSYRSTVQAKLTPTPVVQWLGEVVLALRDQRSLSSFTSCSMTICITGSIVWL